MTLFIIIAAFMTLLAVLVVIWPLMRHGNRRWVPGAIAALAIPSAAAALYFAWSTWNWNAAPVESDVPPEALAMVARLEKRLSSDPNNLQGWLLLGRSYLTIQRFDDSMAAYDRAIGLSDGRNADALLGFGEALSLRSGGEITPQAADVFERALKLQSQNPKALLFGGFAAAARGDKDLARSRWLSLKALNPPPVIAQMLDSHLAALEAAPQGAAAGDAAASAREASSDGASAEAKSGKSPSGEASVTVKLAPAFKSRVDSTTALFVFAREPGVQGPPLAVKRLTAAALGSTIKLSSADAMMSGRALQSGHEVEITARISFGGQPLPAAGDLYGEVTYEVGKDGVRDLLIDRVAN